MKGRVSSVFWGILFILGGGFLLADRMGWIDLSLFSTNTWVYVFGAAGLIFLLGYFLSGFRNWGLLFPALILGSIGLTMWMGDHGVNDSIMGVPILLAIAIPFIIGFLMDRKAWGLLIPAWALIVSAIAAFLADRVPGTLVGALVLFGIAIPFLIVYLLDRSRWWALIPAFAMVVIGAITLLSEQVNGNLIGAIVMYAIALPFLVVYLNRRSRWWALIPAWIMFVIGTIVLLSEHVDGNLIGALVMYSIGLPFLVVYLRDRNQRWALIPASIMGVLGTLPLIASVVSGDWGGVVIMLLFSAVFFYVYFRWNINWWALIPAGVFATIAVVVFLGIVLPAELSILQGILTGTLLLGFGLTFGALWLLRKRHTTAWASYPAIGLFVAALLAYVFGSNSNLFWAVALLAGGVVLVVYSLLRKRTEV